MAPLTHAEGSAAPAALVRTVTPVETGAKSLVNQNVVIPDQVRSAHVAQQPESYWAYNPESASLNIPVIPKAEVIASILKSA